jgi:hypothetical protein
MESWTDLIRSFGMWGAYVGMVRNIHFQEFVPLD